MSAKAEQFECEGWYDGENRHNACTNPNPTLQGKGRCARCYSREYNAHGSVRAPQIEPRRLTIVEPQRETVKPLPEETIVVAEAPQPAPTPIAETPPATVPAAPVLRARHIKAVTRYAAVCPNCDAEIVAGETGDLRATAGHELRCAGCGALWQVTGESLSELPQ